MAKNNSFGLVFDDEPITDVFSIETSFYDSQLMQI